MNGCKRSKTYGIQFGCGASTTYLTDPLFGYLALVFSPHTTVWLDMRRMQKTSVIVSSPKGKHFMVGEEKGRGYPGTWYIHALVNSDQAQ